MKLTIKHEFPYCKLHSFVYTITVDNSNSAMTVLPSAESQVNEPTIATKIIKLWKDMSTVEKTEVCVAAHNTNISQCALAERHGISDVAISSFKKIHNLPRNPKGWNGGCVKVRARVDTSWSIMTATKRLEAIKLANSTGMSRQAFSKQYGMDRVTLRKFINTHNLSWKTIPKAAHILRWVPGATASELVILEVLPQFYPATSTDPMRRLVQCKCLICGTIRNVTKAVLNRKHRHNANTCTCEDYRNIKTQPPQNVRDWKALSNVERIAAIKSHNGAGMSLLSMARKYNTMPSSVQYCVRRNHLTWDRNSSKLDLTGQVAHNYRALNPTEKRAAGFVVWNCVCLACNSPREIISSTFKSGKFAKCSCQATEQPEAEISDFLRSEIIAHKENGSSVSEIAKLYCINNATVKHVLNKTK